IGPQEAEQNPYHAIKLGFDHPDFLHLRAPKPSLIVTTTNGFFSQQGARETFAEAQKSYAAFGKPDNIQKVESFGVHESTKSNREAVYAFFQKFLKNPGDSSDNDIEPFSLEDLWVTKTGQLSSSIKGETVFNLNKQYFAAKKIQKNKLKEKITELAGIQLNKKLTTTVFTGKIKDKNFGIEKYFLENDKNDFALPVYVMKNTASKPKKILVWLSTKGKDQILEKDIRNNFLQANYTIVSVDLPGTGELFDPSFKGDGFIKKVPFNYTFGANLVGKSIPGIQAESIDLLMQFVEQQNVDQNKIDAFVEEETNAAFLHFTTLKNPFSKIVLVNPLESNFNLIETEYYDPKLAYAVVPGSLPYYDFKDLVSLLPENSVKIFNPVNALGENSAIEINNSTIIKFLNGQ
ncbi:MAG: hypothetical protein L3J11_04435, partial [Draconibacterium sp.]|nr:hypothetical protein [Draconibacterium sp.]